MIRTLGLLVSVAGLAWALSLTSCFDEPKPDCAFLCGGGNCPDGYSCRPDGWCKRDGVADSFDCAPGQVDAAINVDAGDEDAAPPDAGPDASPDAGLADGTACTGNDECDSGFCVDNVCCDTACTAGCETCLASEGAADDGTCSPRTDSFECRGATGACDVAETCNGTDRTCPTDEVASPSVQCGTASGGECDADDFCNGTDKTCPDQFVNAGTQCTDTTTDDCDDAQCDGSGACVQDQGIEDDGTLCAVDAGDTCCSGVCSDEAVPGTCL